MRKLRKISALDHADEAFLQNFSLFVSGEFKEVLKQILFSHNFFSFQ